MTTATVLLGSVVAGTIVVAIILYLAGRIRRDYSGAERAAPPDRDLPRGSVEVAEEAEEDVDDREPLGGDPTGRVPRYANVRLSRRTGEPLVLGRNPPVAAGETLTLQVGIGELDAQSVVLVPRGFPAVSTRDVLLRVRVSSADFTVGVDAEDLVRGVGTVEQPLLLPGDGSPARTVEDGPWLDFALRWGVLGSPPPRPARARISYYFRDALVQSQRLDIEPLGPFAANVSVVTDYTASGKLDDLELIPDVPRFSVVINDGPATTHQVVLRPPGGAATDAARPVSLSAEPLGRRVKELRTALAAAVSGKRRRSQRELKDDLRRLAPIGRDLYRSVFMQAGDVLGPLATLRPRPLLSISRPKNVTFTIPWTCLYQIGLPSSVPIEKVPFCPLVENWDGTSPLVDGPTEECPWAGTKDHTEGLLCPFGFLGFGQPLESPATAWSPDPRITLRPGAAIAVAKTEVGIDKAKLAEHVEALRDIFKAAYPDHALSLTDRTTVADVRKIIAADPPFVYFFCHGQKTKVTDSDVFLGIGRDEPLPVGDFIDWVAASYGKPPIIWTHGPLVFINACRSLEISPGTIASYADAFIGAGNAIGVIGTEIKVPQNLATEYAEIFFTQLIGERAQLGTALRAARFAFLASGSLFGLAYSAHAWAHVEVAAGGPG